MRWDVQVPHKHNRNTKRYPKADLKENFCRNPDGEKTIWCYTTNKNKRWEYCDPIGHGEDDDSEKCKALEKKSGNGADYRGNQDRTATGKVCMRWDQQNPHKHDRSPTNNKYKQFDLKANYCRNPDGHSTIWCYTMDPKKRYEVCEPRATCKPSKPTPGPAPVKPTTKPVKPVEPPVKPPVLGNRCRALERMFGNGKNYRGHQ